MHEYVGTKAKVVVLRTNSEHPRFETHTFKFGSEVDYDAWIAYIVNSNLVGEHVKDEDIA